MRAKHVLRKLSNILLFTGAFILIGCAFLVVQARLHEASKKQQFGTQLAQGALAPLPPVSDKTTEADSLLTPGSVIGQLKIPRIGVDVMVLQGVDAYTLRLAAGHIPGTAMPGDPYGNVSVAAHRDTFFRPLRRIRQNDTIEFRTLKETHLYRVEFTRIVNPEDVAVLDNVGRPVLTLVTCYPFFYVGSAPERFIVRAVETSSP